MTTRWVAARIGGGPPTIVALTVEGGHPWPSRRDTGPPAGTVLTDWTGGVDIPAGTYRRTRFPAGARFTRPQATTLEDCEIGAWTLVQRNDSGPFTASRCRFVGGISLSSATGAMLSRCQIVGKNGGDLVHITSDSGRMCTGITLRDCWIGDAVLAVNDHLDGMHVRGVSGLTVERCSIDVGPWRTTTNGGLNAAVFLETANGGNANIVVRDCYLSGGGYILRAGTGGHAGLVVERNRFGPDGRWGAVHLDKVTPTRAVDNLYLASGTPAGLPVIA